MNPTVPVSVIVPTRNAAAFVGAALQSVVAQIPQPAEILVIDGGSTDGTVEISRGFPGVAVITQTGRGLASARNEAIRGCSQPLIAFCDADDRWTPGALGARVDALAVNPATLAVIGLVVLEPIEGTVPTAAQQDRIGREVPGFTPGAMLARREAFERVGWFDESLSIGGDSDWFIRLHQSGCPAVQIDSVVLRKGANAASLSTDIAAYRRELLTMAKGFIARKRGISQ